MKRLALVLILLIALCVAASAQGPGGPGGGSGPFAQFRESHKYTFMLSRMAANIGRLSESKAPLTPKQAKAVLAVLQPLRKKTSLTQDEAKDSTKKLKAVLTEKQLTAIGKMKPEHRFGGPGGQGRPGGQGGQGRMPQMQPGQGRPRFDMSAMKNFNPFNPPKGTPMAERGAKRMNDLFDDLKKIATPAPAHKGKK